MKRRPYTLPILALVSAGLLLWWAFGSSPADTFGSRGLFAAQGHRDAQVVFTILATVLLSEAASWCFNRARASTALLVVTLSLASLPLPALASSRESARWTGHTYLHVKWFVWNAAPEAERANAVQKAEHAMGMGADSAVDQIECRAELVRMLRSYGVPWSRRREVMRAIDAQARYGPWPGDVR